MKIHFAHVIASLCLSALCVPNAFGQTNPLEHRIVTVDVRSGIVRGSDLDGAAGAARGVIWSELVQADDASWIRLQFAKAELARTPAGGQPTVLRMTSLLDGAVQVMNAAHLAQWQNTSAYFNGSAVRVELVADARAGASEVVITQVWAGVANAEGGEGDGIASICLGVDDRVLSSEAGNARLLPAGCTAWIINDANRCMLTAGHCGTSGTSVVQFNVPLSSSSGGLNHPPPEDQYAVDAVSIQFTNGGIGNDWCYFGCFANSNTGLTPYEAQGEFYPLAPEAPAVSGQPIRITGYGTVSSPMPPEWDQVQKTHTGPYVSHSGNVVRYQTDTTGGNSGSPVFDLSTNLAIGIHTHAGCNASGGSNQGTAIEHPGLQNALANPQGVCIPMPPLAFTFPDGLPSMINPGGDTLRVEVSGANGGEPQPGTGMLHYDAGDGFVAVAMNEVPGMPNVYDAVFPAIACETNVKFYFSAQSTEGETVVHPLNAPTDAFVTLSALDIHEVFVDHFETDTGWLVQNDLGLTAGAWERGTPIGGGDRRDPPTDADGSGQCYLTENVDGNSDIDGGCTTLISPTMSASQANSYLEYYRWFASSSTGTDDSLTVQVSDDDGASWVTLETYTGTAEMWVHKQFRIADIPGIKPTDQFRVRFRACDFGTATIVEAGLDGVMIRAIKCEPKSQPCPADINSSGDVGVDDLLAVINAWGPCAAPLGGACPADIAPAGGDGQINVNDLLAVINAWGACP